ncbi:MAG: helicase-related protein [Anaerolineae bacterium]|nr:helicase-related protein [Anaerolineae bacterium]
MRVDASDLASRARNQQLELPAFFTAPVLVEDAAAVGDLLFLRVRTKDGHLEEVMVEPSELETALLRQTQARSAGSKPADFALLIEAARIRSAYAFDPHFAVSLSGIEPLPHQLEAVYQRLLPQTRLRFLLADDPGAGKTIMTGLLIKELKMRGAIARVLVLCPAPLALQWQDEMRAKFDEIFEVIRAEQAKNQLAGNVWDRVPQCITSIDFAKQADVWPGILRVQWDLVVIDEAHKCAARTYGREVKKTQRYQLAERLSALVERLLLLTATPHQGDPDSFAHFLRLLDADQFVDPHWVGQYGALNRELLRIEDSPWFLRRVKEGLRDFEGRKLFTERHPWTVPFQLAPEELQLYQQVTEYINTFLPRQQSGRRRMSVALARTVLQRRLASSIRAIRRSLERRHERFTKILRELQGLTPTEQRQRLQELQLIALDEEQEFDDHEEAFQDEVATQITAVARVSDLQREVSALERLIRLAHAIEAQGQETKLSALQRCLERAEFAELRDGRGNLLIFTEHRDTLDYLREQLEAGKYACCEIHGGMNAQLRKAAQDTFRTEAQICIATEAAGEGINLQFCHLMINYDMPWNPNRLEQRMGRIHRIGQEYDVHIFNFVATNTVEGSILTRLLDKLDEMREALGGRVFDVIGLILKLNEVNLEEMLREAAYNPARLDEYRDQIERISPARLKELEEATGLAMATSHVDLSAIQQQDFRSEERRLMPEYVEDFFINAAERVGLRVERRADALWRVDHVPERFRAPALPGREALWGAAERVPEADVQQAASAADTTPRRRAAVTRSPLVRGCGRGSRCAPGRRATVSNRLPGRRRGRAIWPALLRGPGCGRGAGTARGRRERGRCSTRNSPSYWRPATVRLNSRHRTSCTISCRLSRCRKTSWVLTWAGCGSLSVGYG